MDREQPKREEQIGALWRKTNARGEEFMTGSVTFEGVKKDIVVFLNGYKKSDKQPDFRILLARSRDKSDGRSPSEMGRPAPAAAQDDDAIPF
jgi:uncharacterized protein (DUF736 family)